MFTAGVDRLAVDHRCGPDVVALGFAGTLAHVAVLASLAIPEGG